MTVTSPATPATTTHARDRDLTERALDQLATPEGWQRWLRVRASFPDRSLDNQALIALQHPQATMLATFRSWLNNGYVVKKRPDDIAEGQYAVRVWEPKAPSRAQLNAWRDAGSDPVSYPPTLFTLTNEFAQDQVAPADGAEQQVSLDRVQRDLAGNDVADVAPRLRALIHELRYGQAPTASATDADGPPPPSTPIIGVAPLNTQVAQLCRSAAWLLVDRDRDNPASPEDSQEPIAPLGDAIAFVCITGLGLNADAVLWPDQPHAAAVDVPVAPLAAAATVNRLARRIEAVLTDGGDNQA